MKKVRKTYSTRGLLDFSMALNIGGAIVRICFNGGYMGSNGVVSAKYTTDNLAIIKMIEKSPQFLSRKIFVIREEELPQDPLPPLEPDRRVGFPACPQEKQEEKPLDFPLTGETSNWEDRNVLPPKPAESETLNDGEGGGNEDEGVIPL